MLFRSNLNWNGVNITDGAVNNTTDATNTTGDATRTDDNVDASKWDPRGDSSSNPTNWWQNYDWGGFYDTGNNVGSGDTTAGSDGTVGSDGTQTGKGDDVVKDKISVIIENNAPALYGKKGGKKTQYDKYRIIVKNIINLYDKDELSKRGVKARIIRKAKIYAEKAGVIIPSNRHAEGIVGEQADKKIGNT